MGSTRKPLPNNLKALRKEQGVTIWGLAILAGASQSTILAIEKYGHCPVAEVRERLADTLGVPVEDIWPHLRAAEQADVNAGPVLSTAS